MKGIIFYKYQSLGNDFIIIDNRAGKIFFDFAEIKRLCDRHFGIGADGIIFLKNAKNTSFAMQIFNSDGTEATMCGNGLACLSKYIFDEIKKNEKNLFVETLAGVYRANKENEKILLEAEYPRIIKKDLKLAVGKEIVEMEYINSGALHVVVKEQNLEKKDILKMGKAIRYHDYFAKDGTNVNFIEETKDGTIRARVYEKGVEDETLACGTGALAIAAIMPAEQVEIVFRGGRVKVFKEQKKKIRILLSPEKVFNGSIGIL